MGLPNLRYVYFWPDGMWADREEYNEGEYSHRSDDYGLLVLPLDIDDDEVDRIVQRGTSPRA